LHHGDIAFVVAAKHRAGNSASIDQLHDHGLGFADHVGGGENESIVADNGARTRGGTAILDALQTDNGIEHGRVGFHHALLHREHFFMCRSVERGLPEAKRREQGKKGKQGDKVDDFHVVGTFFKATRAKLNDRLSVK